MDHSFFGIRANNEKADKNGDKIIDAEEYQQVRGNAINHLEKVVSGIIKNIKPESQKYLRDYARGFVQYAKEEIPDKALREVEDNKYRITGEVYKGMAKDFNHLAEVLTNPNSNLPNNGKNKANGMHQ